MITYTYPTGHGALYVKKTYSLLSTSVVKASTNIDSIYTVYRTGETIILRIKIYMLCLIKHIQHAIGKAIEITRYLHKS